MVSILGTVLAAAGAMYSYVPVQVYVVDAFGPYTASANAALGIIRSIASALVPLAVNPMYRRLGYGWGNTLLAFLALPFVPFAWFLWKRGGGIRTRARFKVEAVM